MNFQKQIKLKLINLTSSRKEFLDDLKEIFPSLEFNCEKIDKVLRKVDITLSFSSTVIEESLYSNVPVILFDRWKRYQHVMLKRIFLKKFNYLLY